MNSRVCVSVALHGCLAHSSTPVSVLPYPISNWKRLENTLLDSVGSRLKIREIRGEPAQVNSRYLRNLTNFNFLAQSVHLSSWDFWSAKWWNWRSLRKLVGTWRQKKKAQEEKRREPSKNQNQSEVTKQKVKSGRKPWWSVYIEDLHY